VLALVALVAAQVSVDSTPLLAAGDVPLANAIVERLLDEGYVLWPDSPRQARLILTYGKDGVVLSLDDDAITVARGDDAIVAVECSQAALGLLRERRVLPGRAPRGGVDVRGHAAALVVGANAVAVPVARRAPRRLCAQATVTLSALAVSDDGCPLDGPSTLSWAAARDDAKDVLLDADLGEVDENGWAEAPRSAGTPGVDERARPRAPLGQIGGRVHALVGSTVRPPSVDLSLAAAGDLVFARGWAGTVMLSTSSRLRDDVRASSVSFGAGGVRALRVGHDVVVRGGAAIGLAVDVFQGQTTIDNVPSLALFVPLSVGYELGSGARVELASWLRVTDGRVTAKAGSRTVWEGASVAAFVGVGASFGADPQVDP
jgi:hypothetical protein